MHRGAILFGMALVSLAIIATVLAGVFHWFALRRLRGGESPVVTLWTLSLTVAALTALLGLVGLWLLFVI